MRKAPTQTSKELFAETVAPKLRKVQSVLADQLADVERIRALDAGCGAKSWFRFANAEITGLDITQSQLDRSTHLTHQICADVQTHDLSGADFDLIMCMDVIEHLQQPQKAIENFYEGLRPGGVVVLAAPVVGSLWAQVTRATPHWLHLFYYRQIIGSKNAGRNGTGPFKTFLHPSIAPQAIAHQWTEMGGEVIYLDLYEGHMQNWLRQLYPVVDLIMKGVGRLSPSLVLSSFLLVARR